MMLLNPYRFAAGGGGGSSFRYWRLRVTGWKVDGAPGTGDVRVSEWALFTAADAEWPTADMTGASAPIPFVASASSDDGSRPAWGAFDGILGDGTNRWISAGVDATPHLQIDLGSAVAVTYMKLAPDNGPPFGGGYYITDFTVYGSNTGAFAGEETAVYAASGLVQGDWTSNTYKTFTF